MVKKYRLIHDENLCIGCQACNIACRVENSVPDDFFRLQVRVETKGIFPHMKMDFRRLSCVMCDDAPCVDVCPTHASFQTKDGLVHVDARLCISCRYCIVACPYDARFTNPLTKVIEKCTFCFENKVAKEMEPSCVSICPTEALIFGDMNKQDSKVYQKSRNTHLKFSKAHLQTKPKVAFVPNRKGVQL